MWLEKKEELRTVEYSNIIIILNNTQLCVYVGVYKNINLLN